MSYNVIFYEYSLELRYSINIFNTGKTSNVTQNQGDNITGKSEAQQLHSSSSTAYNKSSSIDDTSNVLKSSLSGDNSTYTKSVSNSETLSTSSKCSSQTTNASSQHSFEEASKNSLQPGGPRGINANQTPFQQQRQQALQQQQQMMQQGYTNGPNSSSSRPGSNTDPSGYPSMYRSDSGNFSNVGGRPPYGPNNSYNQKNPDFFGFLNLGPEQFPCGTPFRFNYFYHRLTCWALLAN